MSNINYIRLGYQVQQQITVSLEGSGCEKDGTIMVPGAHSMDEAVGMVVWCVVLCLVS